MTEAHKDRAHSRLGASSAYRWMNCPGSVRATQDCPDSDSIYAAEGTAAHELAERVLNLPKGDLRVAHDFIGTSITVGNHVFEVDEEMADAVHLYCETVWADWDATQDVLAVERRFSLEQIRDGMFGTNDALRYRPSTKALTVYDYKHGRGKAVHPDDNPQLLYYALGAALAASWPIDTLELVIVQPRAGGAPVRRWTTNVLRLAEFMSELEAAADRASAPDAPLIPGDWCKASFCPAAGRCDALAVYAQAAAGLEFSVLPADRLRDKDMTRILDNADLIESWVAAVRAEAYRRAEAGEPPPGWKLVDKAARRQWKGGDEPMAVFRHLVDSFGLSSTEVYAEPKLKSPAQVEKLLPKPQRAALADLYEKVSSGTTLVRETDRREAVTKPTAASDFGLDQPREVQ